MFKIFSVAMLIIGTIIGAGFASGREIVAFFGTTPAPLVALVCAALVFVMCLVFLFVGQKAEADDIGTVNKKLAGKFDVVLNIFLLFNSVISLSAMLAGFDSLFGSIYPLKPLYSVLFGAVSVLVVTKGLKGLLRCNAVLVPALILIIAAVTLTNVNSPSFSSFTAKTAYRSFTYISMNMMLAAAVLTTVHGLTKKQIIAASAVTAVIVGALLMMFMLALGSSSAGETDMPIITMSKETGRLMYGLSVSCVAVGIFTTMLTAHISLSEWVNSFCANRLFSAVVSVIFCLALSFIGFRTVVDTLYPVLGVLGSLYFVVSLVWLFRSSSPSGNKLFTKANGKVHKRCKQAKNNG